MIKVPLTVFQTETLTLTSDLDIQSHDTDANDPYTCNTSTHNRSLGSNIRVETDRWTDTCDCITSHANEVSNKK